MESKDLTKRKARKEFSEKLDKLSEKVGDRSGKQSSSSASHKSGHKDDNKDIDSITYVKSDNVSDKSSLSSGKDKSDKSLQKDKELKEQEVVGTSGVDANAVSSEKSHKVINEDKGEYDEYFDQWESDSEKTVIDSQIDQKSVRDINSRKSSLISEGQKSRKSIESKQSLKSNQSKAKSISDKKPTNGKTVEKDIQKRETKQTKPSVDRKTSDKSQTQSEKSVKSTKSSKTSDKSIENKVSNPMAAKRPSISRGKTIKDNFQSEKISTKTPNVSKIKPKSDEKEMTIKSSDSLEKKSYLSTSDMSLDKSSTQRNELRSSPMKASISNQDINQLDDNKIVTNVSSEESIFDSALVMADMERDDTRMYSDIERMVATEGTHSSLERIQKYSDSSTGEQLEVCNEYQCNTHHKPESRCSHKLHFKTLPPHLGKVEVAHIGSRVDSRRDTRYPTDNRYNRSRVRVVRTVRPSSDGFKSVDPNIITQTVEKSLRK